MKIIKYIFLLIFLVAIAVTVFVATQDGRYDIKKEYTIKLQPPVVYNYINDYHNWKYIGILTDNDTTVVYSYGDKTSGKGALATWKVNSNTGKIQTIKAAENDSIVQKAVINEQESDIKWQFKKTAAGTNVSVRVKGNLTFMDKAYALFNNSIHDRLDDVVTRGLQNLDAFLIKELTTYNTQVSTIVNKKPVFYLKQTVTDSTPDAYKTIQTIVGKLNKFVTTNKIATNGAPFTMYRYNGTAKKSAVFSVCIPIKEEIITALGSEFEGGRLNGFNALKVTLKGDYSHAGKAWNAGKRYINTNGIPENIDGDYLEVYTKGIRQTSRPSKWVTDYYLPVGPRTGSLIDTLGVIPPVLPQSTIISTTTRTGNTTPVRPQAAAVKKPANTATGTLAKPLVSGSGTVQSKKTPSGTTPKPVPNTVKPSDKPKTTGTAQGTATAIKSKSATPATGTTTKPATGNTTTKPAGTTNKPAQPATAKPASKPAAKPVRTLPDEFN